MNAEQLSRVGEKLVKRCGSRDPFEIARQLGINVMLCENFGSLKGMYRVIKRNRFIFLNNSLDENMLRIVCAHELGHDQLHRNMAKTTTTSFLQRAVRSVATVSTSSQKATAPWASAMQT